jgi:predicted house-cleaning noncanonical NTP pyrophosphatase (MazG superfamily)
MIKKHFYRKLIRDKIPEIIKASGNEGKVTTLSNKKFEKELKKKLVEESKELANVSKKKDILNELADVLELVKSVAESHKIRFKTIEKFQKEKRIKRGGFKKKLFLVWSTEKN